MKNRPVIKEFLKGDKGAVVVEYVVMVAAAGILLAVGVWVLFNAMSNLFGAWAGYFKG